MNSCVTLTLFVQFGADAEPPYVRCDQQRRVLQRELVLPQLVERRVEVGAAALVLPCEAAALPHVGLAVAAGVLPRTALEAVLFAPRVGLHRSRLAEQTAQVAEVFLRRRAFLQLRRSPLGDELAGVIAPTATTRSRADGADRLRVRMTRHRSSMSDSPFLSCSVHHAVASCYVQARLRCFDASDRDR